MNVVTFLAFHALGFCAVDSACLAQGKYCLVYWVDLWEGE